MCVRCGPGSYRVRSATTGLATCALCARAKYKPDTSASLTCVDCPRDKNSGGEGTTTQLDCQCVAGSTGANGSAACTLCAQGTYKSGLGSFACANCTLGSDSGVGSVVAEACTCNAGYIGPDGQLCTACVAGKYKAESGSVACTLCNAHSYSPQGVAKCTCNAGYTGPDGQLCTACVAGKYKAESGSVACTVCNAHSYSPQGSDSVAECTCNAGYSALPGQNCAACRVGKYSRTGAPGEG